MLGSNGFGLLGAGSSVTVIRFVHDKLNVLGFEEEFSLLSGPIGSLVNVTRSWRVLGSAKLHLQSACTCLNGIVAPMLTETIAESTARFLPHALK